MATPSVLIGEVGPRDGLQSVARTMPTAAKLAWIDALHAAGLREIEVGSFVPAALLPQMAYVADVVRHALALPGLTVLALVPNLRGAEAALTAHLHNTRGLGLANCLAAYDVGVRTFDASLGGLGGCPYAPGASGNVGMTPEAGLPLGFALRQPGGPQSGPTLTLPSPAGGRGC